MGPAIIETDVYIRHVFQDHLLDNTAYMRLNDATVKHRVKTSLDRILKWVKDTRNIFDKKERMFVLKTTKLVNLHDALPKFYGNPKIHKSEWKLRPIVSVSGSIIEAIAKFVEAKLHPLTKYIPSYIDSSRELKDALLSLPPLPPNARLFTADAVSMYTNIETSIAIPKIDRWLRRVSPYSSIQCNLIMQALCKVMHETTFEFGNTHFQQRHGVPMGTPPGCAIATIYYAIHEEMLLERFNTNLLYYCRYIDDMFGI